MHINEFNSLLPSYKITQILSDPNPDYIYGFLSYKIGIPYEELKSKYEISIHKVRQRIYIKSDYEPLAQLFQLLNRFGLKYESVQQTELRIDINVFFNFIK